MAHTVSGIPEADLARIFEPFFTTKEVGQGNGLGLMVAKGIASDHGGSIEVENVEDGGTEFCVLVPLPGAGNPSDIRARLRESVG